MKVIVEERPSSVLSDAVTDCEKRMGSNQGVDAQFHSIALPQTDWRVVPLLVVL